MNKDTLFDILNDDVETNQETFFFISKKGRIYNSLVTLAVNKNNNKIYKYSCEWFYLLGYTRHKPKAPIFNTFAKSYNNFLKKQFNEKHKDKKIIPLVSSFSRGTTHGYSCLYFALNEYIKNKEIYKDHYIALYMGSQKGLLDIVHKLVDKQVIDKTKIIYLDSEIKYLFKSITFIPNKWHEMYTILNDNNNYHSVYDNLIVKYFVNEKYVTNHENICLIKGFEKTKMKDVMKNFTKLNKLYHINVLNVDEIERINMIYYSKIFVCSWGTSFFKNFFYISEKCEKIIVIVIGHYRAQYNRMKNHLIKKYKNANVYYYFVDNYNRLNSFNIPKIE
tara:strand:- start:1434 stop:2435 length:1002 start_codon:yes stop_codon:yes gene_type:complete